MKNLLKYSFFSWNIKAAALLLAAAFILASCDPAIKAGGDEAKGEKTVSVQISIPTVSPLLSSLLSAAGEGSKGLSPKAYLSASQVELILRDQTTEAILKGGATDPWILTPDINSQNAESLVGSFVATPGAYRLEAVVSPYSGSTVSGWTNFVVQPADTAKTVVVICTPDSCEELFSEPASINFNLQIPWTKDAGNHYSPGSEVWYSITASGDYTQILAVPDINSQANPMMMVYDASGVFVNGGPSPLVFSSSLDNLYYVGVIDMGEGDPSMRYFTLSHHVFIPNAAPNAPGLYTPDDGAIVNPSNAYFQWLNNGDPTPTGTLNFVLEISQDDTWMSSYDSYGMGTNLSASLSTLTAGTTYYWRVLASDGLLYELSEVRTVYGNAAPSCSLLSPSDLASGLDRTSITFTWEGSDPNPETPTYLIQIATDSLFINTYIQENVGNLTQATYDGFALGTKFYWRVFAMDNFVSSPSYTWSFTTNYAPVASFSGPDSVDSGATATFDASSSYDNDLGDTLTYYWYLNGGYLGVGGSSYTTPALSEQATIGLAVNDSQGNWSDLFEKLILINAASEFYLY